MNNLRRGFERFCFRNQNKGIPNLMLYIVLGNALVILMSMIIGNVTLYELLSFDKAKILEGQVWRLFTYVFIQSGNGIFPLLFLYDRQAHRERYGHIQIQSLLFLRHYSDGCIRHDLLSHHSGHTNHLHELPLQ